MLKSSFASVRMIHMIRKAHHVELVVIYISTALLVLGITLPATAQTPFHPGSFNEQFQTFQYKQFSTCNGFETRFNSFTVEAAADFNGAASILDNQRHCVPWVDQALDPILWNFPVDIFEGVNISTTHIDLNYSMWNEDFACIFPNDPCSPDQPLIFGCNDCDGLTGNSLQAVTDGPIGQWDVKDIGSGSDIVKVRKIWRPSKGDYWYNTLDFGTLTNNSWIRHPNSNRKAPQGANEAMAYADRLNPSNSGNRYNLSGDIFYKFTILTDSEVGISTQYQSTNILTHIGLMNASYQFLIDKKATNFNDHASIYMALSAGTYIIAVEGARDYDEGEITTSVIVRDLKPDGGIIASNVSNSVCPGDFLPEFSNSQSASYDDFEYSNVSVTNNPPIYGWYISANGGTRVLQPGANADSLNFFPNFTNFEFNSMTFERIAHFGSSYALSNPLTFYRCDIPVNSNCESTFSFQYSSDLDRFIGIAPIIGITASGIPFPDCVAMEDVGAGIDSWITHTMPYTGRIRLDVGNFPFAANPTRTDKWGMVIYKGGCGQDLQLISCEEIDLGVGGVGEDEFVIGEASGILPGEQIIFRFYVPATSSSTAYGNVLAMFITTLACSDIGLIADRSGTGNWNNASSWLHNVIPEGCDEVNISNGNINVVSPSECAILQVDQGKSLNVNTGATLTVYGHQ